MRRVCRWLFHIYLPFLPRVFLLFNVIDDTIFSWWSGEYCKEGVHLVNQVKIISLQKERDFEIEKNFLDSQMGIKVFKWIPFGML